MSDSDSAQAGLKTATNIPADIPADTLTKSLNLTSPRALKTDSGLGVVNGEVVEHPNYIPDGGQADLKGKPPLHSNPTHLESNHLRNKSQVVRSISHDARSDSHESGNRGSLGSFGSNDSRNNEEEVVISYQDEAVDIDEQGAGNEQALEVGTSPTRLVIISSKMKNTTAIRHSLKPGVLLVQYKYDNTTIEGISALVARSLGSRKCLSIAFILSCSGLSIQLCRKDDKLQVLTKDTVCEDQSIREFFSGLVKNHMDQSTGLGLRLDFLACNLLLHTDGGSIDKEIESCVEIPVHLYKDLGGSDTIKIPVEDGFKTSTVGEMYFKIEKLRGWSGQQQQTLAGFEKIQTVGKGAYGAAVLYKKKDDDSLVILKEINMHDLKASERQMALNEVNILAMLEHPNIISYFDSFEEDGVIMIEMEYADGGTVSQYLQNQEKPLEERDILNMFQQIVAAIRHIHEHNILHRDLKTANIFLTKEGVVKVGDFGISKMLSTANKGANTVLGTPYYISPEMCEGKPYNDKSDIWALGCILYEITCRQKTFEGSNLPALVNKIMKGQFAPVKGNYSQELKDLIMLMLSQDPSLRPSAHDLMYLHIPKDPSLRPSAHDLMYLHIPKLLAQFEEHTSETEEDSTNKVDSESSSKKTRSVLFYFDSATADLTPVELNPKMKIRSTAVGADHVIVVTTESQVFAWGEGTKGQLGHGDTNSIEKPKLVEALSGKSIHRACCGDGFSVFVSNRGIVLTSGDGTHGCLGHADWSSVCRPRLIESLLSVDVIAVACGTSHVVVVGSDGEVFAWGSGTDGKLGLGTEDNQCQPMKVTIAEPVVIREVFCGLDGTMLLTDVGSVFSCGNNRDNKLGLNNRYGFIAAMRNIFTKCEVEGQKVPTTVRSLSSHRVVDISMGAHHTAVIVEPGHLITFGRNVEGQLGIGGTKPANNPVQVKAMKEKNIVRVQCGDHYTVSSTDQNEIYYWGLRFKDPTTLAQQQRQEDSGSRSSVGEPLNRDDMRIESVTPRAAGGAGAGHSRQASTASGISLPSLKDGSGKDDQDGDTMKEGQVGRSPQRQTSVDSSLSGLTDSGYTGDVSASEIASRTGFRPLSSVPRRSTSASSQENSKDKDKDNGDSIKDDSQIIYPPDHLMRIVPGEEMLTLNSFFCHGENIFIHVETTAPAPRRKSRKKRGIRKRYSGSTLPVPSSSAGTSASSREGGDEYSSEASEIDTQGTVPGWLRQELAVSQMDVPDDGNLPDDTSDVSEDDRKHATVDNSMSSIQINRDLTPQCKLPPDKNLTPRNTDPVFTASNKKVSPREVCVRSFSNQSTESEVDNSNQSDGSTKDVRLTSEKRSKTTLEPQSTSKVLGRYQAGGRAKSAATNNSRSQNRLRPNRMIIGQDVALKDKLAARGFVSDVTVRRREEALLGELKMTRDEKVQAEKRLKELQEEHERQQERLRVEAEQRALEREKQLQEQITLLQQQLMSQSSQLQDNQKMVSSLQNKVNRNPVKKKKSGNGSWDSKVCVLQ